MSDGEGDNDILNLSSMERAKDDESDNSGSMSCDDEHVGRRIKRFQRHTTQQTQELETFFKECTPRPNKNQRSELAQRVNLEDRQIKYWFQNRRTQERMHRDSHDNVTLRQEHERLLRDQEQLKEAREARVRNLCNICNMPTYFCEIGIEVQQLKVENAKLKQEIDQLNRILCGPIQLPAGPSAVQPSSSSMISNAPLELDSGGGSSMMNLTSKLLDLAKAAMKELVMLGQSDSPFWRINPGSNRETLNYEEYKSVFNNGIKPPGCVIESSRDTGSVLMTSLALVKTLMDLNKWVDVFAPIVHVATSRKVISTGPSGARNDSLQLIKAEFIVPSPLVPKREVKFLRYCKLLQKGVWVVVDVTPTNRNRNLLSYGGSARLPSGLIIKDMGNDYSMVTSESYFNPISWFTFGCMVTWIEQMAYDESHIHQLYQPLIGSGIGLGAKRWLKTLQRHCQILSTLWNLNMTQGFSGMSAKGRAEIVKLAQRMTLNYHLGISDSSVSKWESIQVENERQNMRLVIRKKVNEPGELTGVVLSAATSVRFPVSQQKMFHFLSNQNFRNQWDILAHDTSMEEKDRIQIANRHGNYVSLLQIVENGMLVLQEIWNDTSGALVVYAPVDDNSMEEVMMGGDSDFVHLLPSGFSILPDRETGSDRGKDKTSGACLLTLGFQFLVSSKPTSEVTQSFVKMVEGLLDCTIGNIKSGLQRET
ncbi:unnamed protein product [Arabis nemorensis]|uniref:Homeobox domain-containing protein n=1 Tax=Arabis nemorensis TaxID=586526 RepID=A0A565AVG6_9BRAS|nr:unnamed protein product [Arabis nemorensis]